MKKTKRFLSLALVLVMMFSLVQFATALKFDEYSDGDDVKYKEEVAVLTGIGVIGGDDRNNDGVMDFRAADPVTREEAAKIIAYLLLTPVIAEALPASATGFPDVAQTDWSAKFVSYCSSQGIIKGRSDGKFYPRDNVTAAELAIMLMRALGVGNPERYTGVNWEMNAIVDGMDLKLLTTGVDYTKAATREETVKYAFEALFYSPSGKSTEQIYNIKTWDPVTGPVYGWIDVPVIAKDSLAGKRYAELKNNEFGQAEAVDALGRPSKTWTYNKETIYVMATDPVATFSGTVSQNDLFRVVGYGTDSAAYVKYVLNSASGQSTATLTSLRNENGPSNAGVYTAGGRGIITEIYKTGNDGTVNDYKAVIIKPTFAQVYSITATAATSSKGAFATYTMVNSAGKAGVVYSSNVYAQFEQDTARISGDVAAKDYVLYYMGKEYDGTDILYIDAVDTITGIITSITSLGVVTIDGTVTGKAAAITGDLLVNATEGEYYVDSFGYILGTKSATDTSVRVALIVGADTYAVLEDGKVITKYTATIVDMDGALVDVPAVRDYSKIDSSVLPALPALVGAVCNYTVGTTGNYTFTALVPGPAATSIGNSFYAKTNVVEGILRGTQNLDTVYTSTTDVTTASNTTKFYIVNKKDDDVTVSIVTGINSISTMGTFTTSATPLTNATAVSYGASAASVNQVANVVYIYNSVLTTSAQYVFYLGSYEQLSTGVTINVHKSGVTGTIAGIDDVADVSNPAPPAAPTAKITRYRLYLSVDVDSTGAMTVLPILDSFTAPASMLGRKLNGTAAGVQLDYSTGVLFFGGTSVGLCESSVPVFTIDGSKTPNTMDTGSAGDLVGTDVVQLLAGDYAVAIPDENNQEIVAIYIFLNT